MAMSSEFLTFKNKMRHFDDDIEFIDILNSTVKENSISPDADKLFELQNAEKHPNISKYSICQDNRLLIVRHLKSTVYSSYIKDMYEEVTLYLRSIATEAYQNASVSPQRIIGEHKVNMSAVDILSRISDGTLTQTVIDNMFQVLENERSTISLIKKTCSKLGLTVNDDLLNNAVYYLEIRHKLVHTDGYADHEFKSSHPNLRYTTGNYIDLTYQTIIDAKNAVFALVDAIDRDAIGKDIIKKT